MLNLKNLIEKLLSNFMPIFKKPTMMEVLVDDKYKFEMLILDAKKNLEHAQFHLNYLLESKRRISKDINEIKEDEAKELYPNMAALLSIPSEGIKLNQHSHLGGFKEPSRLHSTHGV
jgi:Na+/phosphate symporter